MGDFLGQVNLSCENIITLLQHIGGQLRLAATPNLELIKVYLRNPQDLNVAEAISKRYFGAKISMLFFQGDICRRKLLIEIDGMCQFN